MTKRHPKQIDEVEIKICIKLINDLIIFNTKLYVEGWGSAFAACFTNILMVVGVNRDEYCQKMETLKNFYKDRFPE